MPGVRDRAQPAGHRGQHHQPAQGPAGHPARAASHHRGPGRGHPPVLHRSDRGCGRWTDPRVVPGRLAVRLAVGPAVLPAPGRPVAVVAALAGTAPGAVRRPERRRAWPGPAGPRAGAGAGRPRPAGPHRRPRRPRRAGRSRGADRSTERCRRCRLRRRHDRGHAAVLERPGTGRAGRGRRRRRRPVGPAVDRTDRRPTRGHGPRLDQPGVRRPADQHRRVHRPGPPRRPDVVVRPAGLRSRQRGPGARPGHSRDRSHHPRRSPHGHHLR